MYIFAPLSPIAASFVLPISNPANLVLFQSKTPVLWTWLQSFALPSIVAIAITFVGLRWTQRAALRTPIEGNIETAPLSGTGKIASIGIVLTALVLMGASMLQIPLGLPTLITGVITFAIVVLIKRKAPWPLLRDISWSVLPLVAGLFIMVESLNRIGFIKLTSTWANNALADGGKASALGIGALAGFLCNLMNNLPAGLVAALTLHNVQNGTLLRSATLVGVDLGPNLSITRFACNHPLVDGTTQRRRSGQRLAILQTRVAVDAARSYSQRSLHCCCSISKRADANALSRLESRDQSDAAHH